MEPKKGFGLPAWDCFFCKKDEEGTKTDEAPAEDAPAADAPAPAPAEPAAEPAAAEPTPVV